MTTAAELNGPGCIDLSDDDCLEATVEEGLTALVRAIRWAGQQEREAWEAHEPASQRNVSRPRQHVKLERHAEPTMFEQHRQRARQAGHAHILRGSACATVCELGEHPHISGRLTGSLIEGAEERKVDPHVALGATGEYQLLTGLNPSHR
jgi:hypothetical protein